MFDEIKSLLRRDPAWKPAPKRSQEIGGGPDSDEVAYELSCIDCEEPDPLVRGDRTYSIDPGETGPEKFRERLQEVWRVVASWGRWSPDEREEWPSVEEQRGKLPDYLASAMADMPDEDFDWWLERIEERGWTWWSSSVVDGEVWLTFQQDEMATWWVIELVIEKLGGRVKWVVDEGKRYPFEAIRS